MTAPAGSPVTHGRVLKIALPIMAANISVPILGAVDTAVVGQIPDAVPIAAVGVGAIVLSAIYWVFGFLRMGTTGLVSQASGARDGPEVSALLIRALIIGFAGGLAVVALQGVLFAGAFRLSPASDAVEALARDYMTIRIWSAPAAIAVYGLTGWLIGREKSRAMMGLVLWMNAVNVVLNLWFVLGLDMGVRGVAWASFAAEYSALLLGLWLCRDGIAGGYWRDARLIFDRTRLRRMAVVNTDILIRSLLLQGIFVSFLLIGGGLGDVTLAANQVLLQFLHITGYGMDAFAFAAEVMVGQAVGARALAPLRRAVVLTTLWAGVVAALMAGLFWIGGGAIIDLMTKSDQLREAARAYLPYAIAAPPMTIAMVMLDGVFIGATRSADMRNMMAVSAALYGAAVWALLGPLGNHGLWLALHLSFGLRGLTLALRYPALERSLRPAEARTGGA